LTTSTFARLGANNTKCQQNDEAAAVLKQLRTVTYSTVTVTTYSTVTYSNKTPTKSIVVTKKNEINRCYIKIMFAE